MALFACKVGGSEGLSDLKITITYSGSTSARNASSQEKTWTSEDTVVYHFHADTSQLEVVSGSASSSSYVYPESEGYIPRKVSSGISNITVEPWQ